MAPAHLLKYWVYPELRREPVVCRTITDREFGATGFVSVLGSHEASRWSTSKSRSKL
jgi:hypothetical protein